MCSYKKGLENKMNKKVFSSVIAKVRWSVILILCLGLPG